MYRTIRHISSYIKGILFLAVLLLNLGTHQVCAEISLADITDPSKPYPISTADEFAEAFEVHNSGTLKIFSISLSNDIDMAELSGEHDFAPLKQTPIQVILEGNGHTIKNLSFAHEVAVNYPAIFPVINADSKITDVSFENLDVTLNGKTYAGILTAYVYKNATITNCSLSGKVKFQSSNNSMVCGGVVGFFGPGVTTESEFNNITTDLEYELPSKASSFGGVFGSGNNSGTEYFNIINNSKTKIKNANCTNGIGGIFGYFQKSPDINIHDCENYLSIEALSPNVGGIVGSYNSEASQNFSQIYNCSNAGNIHSDYGNVGGIVGKSYLIDIHDCVNIGSVSSYETSLGEFDGDGGIGGIVGHYRTKDVTLDLTAIYSCVNLGNVTSTLDGNVAGIVGYYSTDITSYNKTATTSAAKIFPFKNCLSLSTDKSNRMVGEFLFNDSPEFNCIGGLYADSTLGVRAVNDSIHYLNHSTLISGKVPFFYYASNENFLIDNQTAEEKKFKPAFIQKEGYYPKVAAENDIAKLASLPIVISETETIDSIASGFNCVMDYGVVWSSAQGKFKVSEDGVVIITGTGNDTIIGTIGNATIKRPIVLFKNIFGGGSGSYDNPYLLKSLAHLEELRDSLQTPGWSKEKHFRVEANISGLDFSLSTTRSTQFIGEFDGNGHTITLNINNATSDAALFMFAESAYLHDIQTSGVVTSKGKAAGVCASAYNCLIHKCFNSAKISGVTSGGVVAYSEDGIFSGLCNSGSIYGSNNAGGVIGNATDLNEETMITDCVNSGYIKGNFAGGLIGKADKISATFQFERFINYGSVHGLTTTEPYAYTTQTGFTFNNSFFDIQITKNGFCQPQDLIKESGTYGLEIELEETYNITFERYSDDANAAFIPSFVKKMKNSELLGILPTFENDELSSFVQTSPKLLSTGVLKLRKIGETTEYSEMSELANDKDIQAILVQKSVSGDERETFITIAGIPFKSGDGSENNPYEIESISDLQSLAKLVESNKVTDDYYVTSKTNNWSYNKHFKLTNDILGNGSPTSVVTSTIASADNPFQGVFDGNGHTIELSINNQNQNNQALFAFIESGAEIKNLIITGIVTGKMNVAGVVANATSNKGNTKPIIYNVINNANVTASSDNLGGICGNNVAHIENCVNAGTISIAEGANPYHTGGIVGDTEENIIGCVNIGNVHGHRRVGGICGSANNEKAKGLIKNCINAGMIFSSCPASAEFVCLGGLMGSAHNFELESSLNLNRVDCNNLVKADAIIGSITGDLISNESIKNCFYDKQMSILSSEKGTGLLTSEITNLEIDGFKQTVGFYPSISNSISGEKIALLTASTLQLFESDDKTAFDKVTKLMNFGDVKLPNKEIKWTSKNGVVDVVNTTNGYTIQPTAIGRDTLIASYGVYSKQIAVDVYCIPVGYDTTITGCQMVSVQKSDGTEIICTNDTTFTEVYPRENSNCDSTIRYTVIINKLTNYLIDTVLCGKDALTGAVYRGVNYTNTEYITRHDTIDCDSAITTKLRVVIPRVDSTYYNSGCDSAFCEVNGKYYYESISFLDTIRSKSCNCDSIIIKVNMNITNSDGYEFDEVYLDSFVINGKTLKGGESATIYDTLVTRNGCDSIVKKNVYVYDRVYKMDTVLYACDFYLDNVNFKKITHDTVLVEKLSETLHGIVVEGYYLQKRDIHITHSSKADTIYTPDEFYCERYILTEKIGGIDNVIGIITKDTVIETKIAREKKCDSVQIRTIHILPAPVKDTVDIINCGDYYDAKLDTTFTSTQDYIVRHKFNNSKCDCDSSITLIRYDIRKTKQNNISISGCSEAEYTFYGNSEPTTFTTTTDTIEVIHYKSGPVCDSIINTIHIAVANPIYDTVMKSTCGDTIMHNGKVYYANDGDYKETITYRSAAGCDSLIRYLDFRFVETIENKIKTKYGCDSVVCDINGKTYFENHTISVATGTTEQGCPIFTVQDLVVIHPDSVYLEVSGCEFAEFNGNVYYNDTSLTFPLKSKLCDCDSFVFVNIKVLPKIESPTIYLTECDSVILNDPEFGTVVIKEDVEDYQCVYTKVHNIGGKEYICDSIVHYNIHVKRPTYNSVTYIGESSVTYNDVVYRRSQTIRDTLINAEGCDSFVEIKIVVERDLGYPVIVDKFGYTLFCNNNIGKIKFASYQWYRDGIAIAGATKEYFEEAKGQKLNGCYQVEVTSETGREYVSEIYCVDKDRELKLYPNPVDPYGTIKIDYPFTELEKKHLLVELYDANGILLNSLIPSSYPIQMEAPGTPGYYFILILESNERMLDARFIVR